MRRINSRLAHRRPELSQHFLRNADVARALVRRMAFEPGDLVVDAGAGDGALTEALADIGCNVIAVEKDERLYRLLARRFADRPNVACRHADILTFPLPVTPYHVVSNVPYAITAALMRRLLHATRPPDSAALIVQREAAEKFAGTPRWRANLSGPRDCCCAARMRNCRRALTSSFVRSRRRGPA